MMNLTMFKLNLIKIQPTINDSPASAQSGIPDQSRTFSSLLTVMNLALTVIRKIKF